MSEVKEYDVIFMRVDESSTTAAFRRIEAYDASDALVQARLMAENDSRIASPGPLLGYHVSEIRPARKPNSA